MASLGLVKAVDGFDPTRGVAFSSYAVPTIVGEIKRHFRSAAWALHVPRALQERVLRVERYERALRAELGRSPTVKEIAAAASMGSEEVLDALAARTAHGASELSDEVLGELGAGVDAEDAQYELVDERLALGQAFRELEGREQTIVGLRLIEGMTQSQIADHVGLSQMQVSRILRRTLDSLRAAMEA